ncbi:unnamed protein product [Bursaphelenchus xylophilus]|uniref:(pine wood nematode) hypothetical protein n=1 Tax=Bursaphelenchus xylophilus TaxID=6326 RepID=A0A1I7S7Y8_BURXY|nr:unnamed protein product [Bursaphelenchus xylophilus]CAG9087244.1 unnamed protein product [Bursaphelenchus xylophilus]
MGVDGSFSDEEELERQLAALNMDKVGGKVKKLKNKASKRPVDDYDDVDDDDLLAELHELMGDEVQEPTVSHKQRRVEQDSKQERAAAVKERQVSLELSEPDDEPGDDEEAELAAIMAAESKSRPAPPKPAPSHPAPPSGPVQVQPPPPPPRAPAGSDAKTESTPQDPSPSDPKTLAKATITRRMAAFTANGLAAHQDGNSGYAAECAETVQMFQQALEMCDTTDITMADLEGIPKTPPPYKRKNQAPAKPVPFPTGPMSLEEELRARLAKFKFLAEDFQSKGENVKMKMNQRLGNQINQALVRLQRGHPIEPDKLPAPPGFGPLKPMSEYPKTTPSAPASQPAPRPSPVPQQMQPGPSATPKEVPVRTSQIPPEPTQPAEDSPEEQKKVLVEKQQKFKKAALMYKQNGDLNAASKCLKAAKALDDDIKRITAHQQRLSSPSAIPASMSAVSVSPASLLIPDLKKQLEMAVKMKTKLTAVKNTSSVQMYERLIQKVRIDLQVCSRVAQGNDGPVSFKVTEVRLPVLEANLDVPADILELKITKIESLKLPDGWKDSDASTFVSYDFPFPHEAHQKGKTAIVYGTTEPEFEEVFQLQINRKAKQLQRVLCRYPLKMFVYQKGGFLRSDKPCGEADIVLDALDENASFSDTRDLLIGRRKTGGKISFEVRIQKPLNEQKMLTLKPHVWTTLTQ